MALELRQVIHINQPFYTKLSLYKPLLSLLRSFKTVIYISNKMEHCSYKSGYVRGCSMHIKVCKRRAGLATDKRLEIISNPMLCKTVIPQRNQRIEPF